MCNGFFGGGNCCWIIILLILICGCGNGNSGCANACDNGCGGNNGCGCC